MNDSTHEHKGFEITLSAPGLAAPYFIRALRRYARDLAHAAALIDGYLAAQSQPRSGVRILAAEVKVVHGWSASARRNATERAAGRVRRNGRFS